MVPQPQAPHIAAGWALGPVHRGRVQGGERHPCWVGFSLTARTGAAQSVCEFG